MEAFAMSIRLQSQARQNSPSNRMRFIASSKPMDCMTISMAYATGSEAGGSISCKTGVLAGRLLVGSLFEDYLCTLQPQMTTYRMQQDAASFS